MSSVVIDPQRSSKLNSFSGSVIVSLFIVVCFTWGTTWIGIKTAIETVPPILASGLRFLIAFPILLLVARIQGEPLLFPRSQRGLFFLIVACYFCIPYLLINVGEQSISSGLAAMLFSSMPVFILIFSAIVLGQPIRMVQMAGIILGFFALFQILREQGATFAYSSLMGALAILAAAIMHALCYVTTKRWGAAISVTTFNTLPCGIAGLILTILGVAIERPDVAAFSSQSIGALIYLGVIATSGGFLAYFYLLKQLNPVVLSFVFLIFPVVAVAVSSVVEGRPLAGLTAVYFVLLLAGFALTKLPVRSRSRTNTANLAARPDTGD